MANGNPADLKQFEINITVKSPNKFVFTINNLPEFDADGKPVAYTIIPANSQAKISGEIYSGYEIRIHSIDAPERTFFRFPLEMRELPRTGFSANRPQALREKPLSLNYDFTGWELRVPSLNVSADIVQVPFEDHDYPVQWLGSAAGLLEGSALPGEGVSILTGHNHLNTTEAGPFALLSGLESGTRLFVVNRNNEMTAFTVVRNELIAADEFTTVEAIANQFDNTLVLLTCENENPEGGYVNRRVIAAIPD